MESAESALHRLLDRIETLGAITDTPGALTRTFLSPANLRAARQVLTWMEEAGMETAHDAGGTIRGVLPGRDASLPPLLLGSHIDTVIHAGKYDGALGVLIALAALEITGPLPFPVHLLAFSDEEGARFHAAYLGSRACTGRLDSETLALRDAAGATLAEVLESEGWHENASVFHYDKSSTRGYLEVHIEQGRVLEELGEPLCAVSFICGQTRLALKLLGRTDHAGTTPMELRRDALAGAAECILAAERLAKTTPGLVATVGQIEIAPGASNTIPGEARFSLDLRHPLDAPRENLLAELLNEFFRIAADRQLEIAWNRLQDNSAVTCDPLLTWLLLDAVEETSGTRTALPSGAGHDAVVMAAAMPVAMLFIRCRDGLSHHPDEYASPEDIAIALRTLVNFLRKLPP